jgi:soluble lytic murein transglycosylase-like protein
MLTSLLLLLYTAHPSISIVVDSATTALQISDSIEAGHTDLVPYYSEIDSAARAHRLPAALLAGVIQEESRFAEWATRMEPRYMRSRAVRNAVVRWSRAHGGVPNAYTELADRARSYGLMQIMGETAREQGFGARYLAELYLPHNSIEHGALLLAQLMKRYSGDTLAAISAYNQGSARKHRGIFANARYVYRVTLAWRSYDVIFREKGGQ